MQPLDLVPSSFSWAAIWTNGRETVVEWATSRAEARVLARPYREKAGVTLVGRVDPPGQKAVLAADGSVTPERSR